MKKPKTLTGAVLTAAHNAWRLKDTAKDNYLNSLLSSYSEAAGEYAKDTAYLVCSGKRTVPAKIARFYFAEKKTYPTSLYANIKEYYSTAQDGDRRKLWNNLHKVLQNIPVVDQKEILTVAKEDLYMFFAMLLGYAWCMDLAGYTYLAG